MPRQNLLTLISYWAPFRMRDADCASLHASWESVAKVLQGSKSPKPKNLSIENVNTTLFQKRFSNSFPAWPVSRKHLHAICLCNKWYQGMPLSAVLHKKGDRQTVLGLQQWDVLAAAGYMLSTGTRCHHLLLAVQGEWGCQREQEYSSSPKTVLWITHMIFNRFIYCKADKFHWGKNAPFLCI